MSATNETLEMLDRLAYDYERISEEDGLSRSDRARLKLLVWHLKQAHRIVVKLFGGTHPAPGTKVVKTKNLHG